MSQAPDFIPAPKPADATPDFIPADKSGQPTDTATPTPGFLDPHAESGFGSRVAEFLRGAVGGVVNPILHPQAALESMGSAAMAGSTPYGTPLTAPTGNQTRDEATSRVFDTNRENVTQNAGTMVKEHPAYLAGSMAGPVAIGEAGRFIPKVARGGAEILSGAKGAAKAGVDAAAEENIANIAKAGEKTAQNAKKAADKNASIQAANDPEIAAAKRAQVVEEVGKKRIKTEKANLEAAAKETRKFALQRGVEHLDPKLKEDLAATHARVKTEADRQFNELNGELDNEEAHPDTLMDISAAADEKIKGTDTEPAVLKSINKRLKAIDDYNNKTEVAESLGDNPPDPPEPLTYRDLQGYRSEIGHELQRGSLPGDVYQAYKGMLERVDDAMQQIADSKGLGEKLQGARKFYSEYANTFLDPKSPVRKALNSTERGGVVKAFAGKDQSGIEALAKHDPELAQKINTVRGYHKEAGSTKVPVRAKEPVPLPELPPKPIAKKAPAPIVPEVVQSEITKLGPEDITRMKQEAISKRADAMRTKGNKTTAVVGSFLPRLLGIGGIAEDLAGAGIAYGSKQAMARILESPRVVEFLSKPTAEDLAQLNRLPADQRASTSQLVEAAKAKGIKIAPGVMAAVGASLPSGHPLAHSMPQ